MPGALEAQRHAVEQAAGHGQERRHFGEAHLDGQRRQGKRARDVGVGEGAGAGGDRRAEERFQPLADVAQVHRHDDVAVDVDRVARGLERLAPLADQIALDQVLRRAE